MISTWKLAIPIALAVATMSCAQPETQEAQPETQEAQTGVDPETLAADERPDPTVVEGGHYKVEFENDRVRVLRITYGPGEESVMHYHPDHVAVFLNDQHWEFHFPDGTTREVHGEAGGHLFVPEGQHGGRNASDQPAHVVAIELKSASSSAAGEAGPDATVVDADHYQTEFENDRLRIVRITYGPGEESVMHYHPDHVAVFLTEHHGEFQFPDGTKEEVHANAGEHVFGPAGQHLPKNIAEEPLELVLVGLK
jgi:quercetin dioxygenase-like cupin family protein